MRRFGSSSDHYHIVTPPYESIPPPTQDPQSPSWTMPAVRDHKRFHCDYGKCNRSFTRPYDLRRHKRTHCDYNEREFVCPYFDCQFRSNQAAGLKCHINSIHTGVRVQCDLCTKSFSDPSSLSKHKFRAHNHPPQDDDNDRDVEDTRQATRDDPALQSQLKRHAAPYTPAMHKSVVRHVKENSRHGVKDILSQFATFALRNEDTAATNLGPTRTKSTPPPSDRSSDQYSQASSRAPSTCSARISSASGYASIVHSPSPSSDSDYSLS